MQTEEQKHEIIMKFVNEVQPKVFPFLAATDANVEYFKAILESNWNGEFSIEWLTNAVTHFKDKFQWLQGSEPAPVLSSKQRRALVNLPEEDWHPERWDDKKAREEKEAAEKKRQYELEPKNIEKAKQECEEVARNASIGSHSDNAEFRKLLSETWVYVNTPVGKRIDYFRSLERRREIYNKAVNNKSVSTHALRAW